MYQLIFHPEANVDFSDGYVWYETEQKGLGNRFTEAIANTLDRIQKQPELFHKVRNNFREASVPVFPYTVVYRVNKRAKTIVIAAIYHAKRNPKRKFRR
jgi:plasmid stabilization system protein ParE